MKDIEVICECSDCSNNENGYCTVEQVVISSDGGCMTYDKKTSKWLEKGDIHTSGLQFRGLQIDDIINDTNKKEI